MNWIKTITKLFSNKSKEQSLDEKLALQVLANTDIDDMRIASESILFTGEFYFTLFPLLNKGFSEIRLCYNLEEIAKFDKDSQVYQYVMDTFKEVQRRKHEKLVKGLLEKVGSNANWVC